jgi:REP element-mobilizing transposase RayT
MKCRFGKIEKNEMVLNEFGMIAYNEWIKLPERFPNFTLDVFQIMPNHMHGIISVGAGFTPAQDHMNQIQLIITKQTIYIPFIIFFDEDNF